MLVDAKCSFFSCFEWCKEGLSSLLFLRHVSYFRYSLPFHFLEDFRQVRDRQYFDPMGIGFVGG